jgi:SNF2 family DNA or RNA helicase
MPDSTEFNFKTKPFAHQRDWLIQHAADMAGALFFEQGTGKTKVIIDNADYLHRKGKIDGVLILAPNGVHQNWVIDELPAHCPTPLWKAHAYESKRAGTKWHARALEELLAYRGLAWLCLSYDAFMTKKGRKAAEKFLKKRVCLYVCDESQRIKTPGAKRTQSVAHSGKKAPFRRILTGTPVTNTPFDVYSQYRFLEWNYWKDRGFASYEAFKTYFGVWETMINTGDRFKPESECTLEELQAKLGRFERVVHFRNLEQLNKLVGEISTRVLKEDVLDLPPKVYTKRYFNLEGEQARLYKSLRDELVAFLESGEMLTTPLIIVQLLRLQQITCGYIPSDDGGTLHRFDKNARLELLRDTLTDVEGSALIFARFREDINQITEMIQTQSRKRGFEDWAAVRYDGSTDSDARLEAKRAFQSGEVRFFVGNPAAAGVGLTLHKAGTVIYYSNSFNLEDRLQSEDRAHRIGQEKSVRYIDLIARGTVDSKIVGSLRGKLNIASEITGDELRAWL